MGRKTTLPNRPLRKGLIKRAITVAGYSPLFIVAARDDLAGSLGSRVWLADLAPLVRGKAASNELAACRQAAAHLRVSHGGLNVRVFHIKDDE